MNRGAYLALVIDPENKHFGQIGEQWNVDWEYGIHDIKINGGEIIKLDEGSPVFGIVLPQLLLARQEQGEWLSKLAVTLFDQRTTLAEFWQSYRKSTRVGEQNAIKIQVWGLINTIQKNASL